MSGHARLGHTLWPSRSLHPWRGISSRTHRSRPSSAMLAVVLRDPLVPHCLVSKHQGTPPPPPPLHSMPALATRWEAPHLRSCLSGSTFLGSPLLSPLPPCLPLGVSLRSFSARPAAAAAKAGKERTVVVVESPSKAAVVGKYLGPGYDVLASYGHVRDLAPKPGSVQPEAGWAMTWAVPTKAHKCLAAIKKALRGTGTLVLASDPDREGEAIAWHLEELLRESGALEDVKVIRAAFNEITREAVLHALAHPRSVSTPLVEAYLARRALDYVMGYGLSPVLWRKLPGSKSAGRVQSVALRLVTDREHAIRVFQQREYWSVDAHLQGAQGDSFEASLTYLDGKRLGQFALATEEDAKQAAARVQRATLQVAEVKRTKVERSPAAPFTTSTLQQEASAKLGFDAAQTMLLAQRLYEGADWGSGLITYMRTDAVTLSSAAVTSIRAIVQQRYGAQFVPPSPRVFKSKAKNAQEAHEAIRPTSLALLPCQLAGKVDPAALRLYSLIWRRTAACQMANAVFDQLGVDVDSPARDLRLHAVTSRLQFRGHLAVHSDKDVGGRFASEQQPEEDEAGSDRDPSSAEMAGLDQLAVGQPITLQSIMAEKHTTQPPPRFTEGTLVKALEEAGVGRPSTYASTLRTLVERAYVRKEARRLIPEMRGLLVSAFLELYFPRYVDTAFTAHLEQQLDDITAGERPYTAVLQAFHTDLQQAIAASAAVSKQQVEDALEERFGEWLFPPAASPDVDPRRCPMCGRGHLEFKLSKMGGFLGCSAYPDCNARLPLSFGSAVDRAFAGGGPVALGADPASGLEISLRTGPYGPYLQLGEKSGKDKPKRVPLPKAIRGQVDLSTAVQLLRLPLELGEHPGGGGPVLLKTGRFGPFVEHAGTAATLPQGGALLGVSLEEAVALLAAKGTAVRGRGRPRREASPSSAGAAEAESTGGIKTRSRKGATAGEAPGKRGRKKAGSNVDTGEGSSSDSAPAEAGSPAKNTRKKKESAKSTASTATVPPVQTRTDSSGSDMGSEGGEAAAVDAPKRGRGRPKKEQAAADTAKPSSNGQRSSGQVPSSTGRTADASAEPSSQPRAIRRSRPRKAKTGDTGGTTTTPALRAETPVSKSSREGASVSGSEALEMRGSADQGDASATGDHAVPRKTRPRLQLARPGGAGLAQSYSANKSASMEAGSQYAVGAAGR